MTAINTAKIEQVTNRGLLAFTRRPPTDDQDSAFREQTIRTTSFVLVGIMGLALLLQVAFFPLPKMFISYDETIAVSFILSTVAAVTVVRRKILAAGYVMTIMWLSITVNLVLIGGLETPITIPVLMLTILIAALVLPRKLLFPIAIFSLAITALLVVLQGTVLPKPDSTPPPLYTSLISGIFVVVLTTTYLRLLRVEFDNRLEASNRALLETQRATEEAQRARDIAEKANKAKEEFLAVISHELRTPLQAIIGYSEMITEGLAGDIQNLTAQQRQYVRSIYANGESLLKQVNNLLDLSKLQAGRMTITVSPAQPRQIIEEIVAKTRVLALAKQLDLNLIIAPETPETVLVDTDKVDQILVNLVGNAIKFTSQGLITIRMKEADTTHWQFEVSDTGAGIAASEQTRIFNAFEQVDSTHTRKYGGTGLGLAITKQFVELMEGTITVDSTPDKGSTFTVILPKNVTGKV